MQGSTIFQRHCSALATEDVMSNVSFMSSLATVIPRIDEFSRVYEDYAESRQRMNRKSELRDSAESIIESIEHLDKSMEAASAVNPIVVGLFDSTILVGGGKKAPPT